MTTLYDATRPVKPSRRFGRGILASAYVEHVPYTAADAEWWASESARRSDRHFDAMAAESAALARLEMGLCC